MDQFDAALKRLDRAVDRLEAALDQREQRSEKEGAGLVQALQAARADQAHTQAVADGVASRLDGAIEQLNSVLER
jgi:ABC-type transporter Mla subunit MlaD